VRSRARVPTPTPASSAGFLHPWLHVGHGGGGGGPTPGAGIRPNPGNPSSQAVVRLPSGRRRNSVQKRAPLVGASRTPRFLHWIRHPTRPLTRIQGPRRDDDDDDDAFEVRPREPLAPWGPRPWGPRREGAARQWVPRCSPGRGPGRGDCDPVLRGADLPGSEGRTGL
jgi:hypothetical protein